MSNIAIAIHGGAGVILKGTMTEEKEMEYRQALHEAIEAGHSVLVTGGSALDAVEAAIVVLEDNALFNAGKGSVFTHEGKIEMDASIMEGEGLMAGAVAGVMNIRNPIKLARAVMEKSEHVLLCSRGAETFAMEQGLKIEPDDYFFTQFRMEQLKHARKEDSIFLDHSFANEKKMGTVGAVALDEAGNIAAATSTGGMTNKKFGRVGDSPVIGAGTYADNKTCAVSCTGHGEHFLRSVVAYDIACLMEYKGFTLKQACAYVVKEKLSSRGAEGGLVALDREGNIELVFNTDGMYRGMKKNNEETLIRIYGD